VGAAVGPPDGVQELTRFHKTGTGISETALAAVRFVPLIPGKAARL
jgi:hypothetical protein